MDVCRAEDQSHGGSGHGSQPAPSPGGDFFDAAAFSSFASSFSRSPGLLFLVHRLVCSYSFLSGSFVLPESRLFLLIFFSLSRKTLFSLLFDLFLFGIHMLVVICFFGCCFWNQRALFFAFFSASFQVGIC